MVGPIQNETAIRSTVVDNPDFTQFLARSGDRVDTAAANQQYPLVRALSRMDVPTGLPIRFHFQMEPETDLDPRGLSTFLLGPSGHKFQIGKSVFHTIQLPCEVANCDLSLSMEEASGSIFGAWHFNEQVVDAETVRALHDRFQDMLVKIRENPRLPISELALGTTRFADWKPAAANDLTFQAMADDVDPVVESGLDESIRCDDPSFDFARFDKVFLTGATGFVGAYLIDALLKTTAAEIICLVRADNPQHAHERLIANLTKVRLGHRRAGESTSGSCGRSDATTSRNRS